MTFIQKNSLGILSCFLIALPAWVLGKSFPVIGGAVIAILAGLLITMVWGEKGKAAAGINWTSKIILQTAVVLLGFGMNLGIMPVTGVPLLFVSYGGSSLFAAWCAIGLLTTVSKETSLTRP